jgi:DNA-binding transcriptional regulator YiaG
VSTKTPMQFKKARLRLRLSVSQCARLVNVDDRTVRRWEQGRGNGEGRDPNPSACRILDLALRDPGAMMQWRMLVGTTIQERLEAEAMAGARDA